MRSLRRSAERSLATDESNGAMKERGQTHNMELNRRRFIGRVAQAGLGLGAVSTLGRFAPLVFAAKSASDKPLKLCMVSGSDEYKSNETLAAFQELIEKKYPVKC